MLALTALNLIVKGALAYYSMHKGKTFDMQVSDDSLSNSKEQNEKSDESRHTDNRNNENCREQKDTVTYSRCDFRCDEVFLQIANILKTPSEESVFNLESLFVELKQLYLYTHYCRQGDSAKEEASHKDPEDITIDIITADFEYFISHYTLYKEKDKASALFKELRPLLKCSLRGDSDLELMNSYFKDKGKDEYARVFLNKIWKCYEDIFLDSNNRKEVKDYEDKVQSKHDLSRSHIRNYKSLLGMAGRTYSKLHDVYKEEGLFEEQGNLSNELVYEIAGTILEYTDFYFCRGLSTPRLAKDIMDSMIDYLHNGLMVRETGQNDKSYVNGLFNRYVGNREIKCYYYFLKMCVKVFHSVCKDCHIDTNKLELQLPDNMRHEIIRNIENYDFPFLRGMSSDEVYADIRHAFRDKDWKLP